MQKSLGRNGSFLVMPIMLIVLFLAAEVMGRLVSDHQLARHAREQAEVLSGVNEIIRELQRERGYSSGVLASDGDVLSAELTEQRDRTDLIIGKVIADLERNARTSLSSDVLDAFGQLAQWRRDVDARELTAESAVLLYTGLVEALMQSVNVVSVVLPEERLLRLSEAITALASAQEAAGLQRAAGSAILGGGQATAARYERFITLEAREAAFLDRALQLLDGETIHTPILTGRTRDPLEHFREEIARYSETGIPDGLSVNAWFETSTAWIDTMYRVEAALSEEVARLADDILRQTRSAMVLRGAIVMLALLLTILQMRVPLCPREEAGKSEECNAPLGKA